MHLQSKSNKRRCSRKYQNEITAEKEKSAPDLTQSQNEIEKKS